MNQTKQSLKCLFTKQFIEAVLRKETRFFTELINLNKNVIFGTKKEEEHTIMKKY